MASRRLPIFRYATTAILVAFTGLVILVLVSNVAYINGASIREVAHSPDIRFAFLLSLATSVASTVLGILIGVPCAYALSRYPFRGSGFLDLVIDVLIVLPVLVIGVSILVFFRMGSEMAALHFLPLAVLGRLIQAAGEVCIYSKAGVVVAQFFCIVSFIVRTTKASFDGIDPRTEQVAMTLGCTPAQAFRRITLPLARPGIVAGAVLGWARAFGIFGAVAFVAGAVRQKTEVLPTSIYLEISIGRLEIALTISLVMTIIAFVMLTLIRLFYGSNIFGLGARK